MKPICTLVLVHMLLPTVDVVFECIVGRWGPQCTKRCGNCEGGPEFCDVYDGFCVNGCASGYYGRYCKEPCGNGFRGQYCKHTCGHCLGSDCNSQTGKCETGCQTGYQAPYCNMPCEYGTWGDGCSKSCQCTDITSTYCGCNVETGACTPCDESVRYFSVKKLECLNEHILTGGIDEYVPPNVLDIPYKPVLAAVGVVAMFVFCNFLWWWFCMRTPAPKEPPVQIQREKKVPPHLKKKIKYKTTLSEIVRRKILGQNDNDNNN